MASVPIIDDRSMRSSGRFPLDNPAIWTAIQVLFLLVGLAPFVLPEFPVETDVYKHVMVGRVLAEHADTVLRYSDYYNVSWFPAPTYLGEWVLAVFVKVCDPAFAAKLYYIAFAAGLWLCCRFYMPRIGLPSYGALLLFPLLHTFYAFSGFLPFVGSIAVYPLLLAVLIGHEPGWRKSFFLAGILVLLHGFHLVGVAIGCFTVFLFAIDTSDSRRPRISWPLIAAMIPAALLMVSYFLRIPKSLTSMQFHSPLGQVKAYLGYNIWTLSSFSGWLFLLLIVTLACAAMWQAHNRTFANGRLLLLALVLVAIGLVMPYQSGNEFVIGSRTLPFALVAAIGALSWNSKPLRSAIGLTCLFLLVSSVLNTQKAFAVQPAFREFLSGMPSVRLGSKLLIMVDDVTLGGNQYINPFNSIEDAYTIYRGGSNPYVLAEPWVPTGATFLRTKYNLTYTSKYIATVPDYHGVSKDYDYIVCWGGLADPRRVIGGEAPLVFQNGRLSIYSGSR